MWAALCVFTGARWRDVPGAGSGVILGAILNAISVAVSKAILGANPVAPSVYLPVYGAVDRSVYPGEYAG